jgi:hypothetical protein
LLPNSRIQRHRGKRTVKVSGVVIHNPIEGQLLVSMVAWMDPATFAKPGQRRRRALLRFDSAAG